MTRMAVGRALAVLALLVAAQAWAGAQTTLPPALSVPDYVGWLDRVQAEVDGNRSVLPAALLRSIPPVWRVETPTGSFDVSNAWLIRDLRELQGKPDSPARARVRDGLLALRTEATAFQDPALDWRDARRRAADILDRREFTSIHGPTWRDRFRQQVLQLIVNLLERLFGSSAIPTVSNILVYTLITMAVVVLALWTYRSLGRDAALESVVPDRVPVSARAWPLWLADAQAAAARGDWRDAVHRAYWCGVSYLETRGTWRPDRARTPREYLRLMSPSHEHRRTLAALTRNFELVWYGTDTADARMFDDVLADLEKLGCRPA